MSDASGSSELSFTQRARQFVVARFDPKSELGLGLTVSVVILGLALWAFSGLLDAVLDNETLVRADLKVASWLHAHATTTGLSIFNVVTQFGSPLVFVPRYTRMLPSRFPSGRCAGNAESISGFAI